jgi:hypothetical protein
MHENRGKLLCGLAVFSGVMLTPMVAPATVMIALSQTTINPAAGQTVNIISTASGSDATNGIKGVDLFVQVDNGGTDNGNGSNPVSPTISNINLLSGIFASNNEGQSYFPSSDGLIAFNSVTTSSGTVSVPANSVVGTITFNAAGIAPGTTFDLYFGNVGANDSDFNNGPGVGSDSDYDNSGSPPTAEPFSESNIAPYSYGGPDYNPVVLTVAAVPEPSMGMAALVLTGAALLGRRKRAAC